MNPKQAIKSIAVVVLAGLALETVHAEAPSNDQANEPRAVETAAAPADAKAQLPVSDTAAAPAKAEDAVATQEDGKAPAAEEPGLLKRVVNGAMSGASDLYERAKAFVMPSK